MGCTGGGELSGAARAHQHAWGHGCPANPHPKSRIKIPCMRTSTRTQMQCMHKTWLFMLCVAAQLFIPMLQSSGKGYYALCSKMEQEQEKVPWPLSSTWPPSANIP